MPERMKNCRGIFAWPEPIVENGRTCMEKNGGVKDEHSKNIELLRSEAAGTRMCELYGADKAEENIRRYEDLVQKFQENFGEKDILMFSSPGRTEISGNHTDHNHGKVLAGSINLDCCGNCGKE